MTRSTAFFLILLSAATLTSAHAQDEPPAERMLPAAQRVASTLYDRLGGADAIKQVVDDFVSRASSNPKVNFTRRGKQRVWEATTENVQKLKKHLTQFLCMATGGPGAYEGRGMHEAHEGLEITDEEFDALAGDLRASLVKAGVGDQEQSELMAIAETTRGAVVQSKAA